MPGLFDRGTWTPALEKFGVATQLSVSLYDLDTRVLVEPLPRAPLRAAFEDAGFDPGLFTDCARQCLVTPIDSPPTVVASPEGLAVVGTALRLDGGVVGAAVAGYAVLEGLEPAAVERLSRSAGLPFMHLWHLGRQLPPMAARQLIVHGELLRVLGDTILREHARSREHQRAAAALTRTVTAKEDFLAVLSHELRTPLAPILGWARVLKSTTDPGRIAHAAEVVERNAMLQIRLVDDLLELNRASRHRLVLDRSIRGLGAEVCLAVEAVSDAARAKQLRVEFGEPPEELRVNADGDRLQQVFRNILLNAVKFTPPGGQVAVTLAQDGEWGVVHVTDTGEGIAPEFLPFIFEMFRQQDEGPLRMHAGLGIGLALVKQLTEAHGGHVSVASAGPGCGTAVTVRLPLAPRTSGMAECATV